MNESTQYSFANNFWSNDALGSDVLMEHMHKAKATCEDLKSFYKERASIEEDYSRKLLSLSRKSIGTSDIGQLRVSLEKLRSETEEMGKTHAKTAEKISLELEEPLHVFAAATRERRKTVEATIEKLNKLRLSQAVAVNKHKEKYEFASKKVNGYLAQNNLLIGKDLQKNEVKLEKAQEHAIASKREYQSAVKVLAETIEAWKSEWHLACEKLQDLEEERIDFLKANLWAFTNVLSTGCVADDESCENIRQELEKCDVFTDIQSFVKQNATGNIMPEAPVYINFLDGEYENPLSESKNQIANFPRSQVVSINDSATQANDSFTSSNNESYSDQAPNELSNSSPNNTRNIIDNNNNNQEKTSTGDNYLPIDTTIQSGYPFDNVTLRHSALYSATSSSPEPRTFSPGASSVYSQATTISTNTISEETNNNDHGSYSKNGQFESRPYVNDHRSFEKLSNGVDSNDPRRENALEGGWNSPFRRRQNRAKSFSTISDASSPVPQSFGEHLLQQRSGKKYPSNDNYHEQRAGRVDIEEFESNPYSTTYTDRNGEFQQNSNSHNSRFTQTSKKSSAYERSRSTDASSSTHRNREEEFDPLASALEDLKTMSLDIQKASNSNSNSNSNPNININLKRATINGPGDLVQRKNFHEIIDISETTEDDLGQLTPPDTLQSQSYKIRRPGDVRRNMSPHPASGLNKSSPQGNSIGINMGYAGDGPISNNDSRFSSPDKPKQQSNFNYSSPISGRNPNGSPNKEYNSSPLSNSGNNNTNTNNFYENEMNKRVHHSYSYNDALDRPTQAGQMSFQQQMQTPKAQILQRQRFQQQSPNGVPMQDNRGASHPLVNSKGRSKSATDIGTLASSYQQQQQSLSGQSSPARIKLPAMSRDGRQVIRFMRALYDYKAQIPDEEVSFSRGDVLLVLKIQEDGWWEVEVFGIRGEGTHEIGLAPSNFLQPI